MALETALDGDVSALSSLHDLEHLVSDLTRDYFSLAQALLAAEGRRGDAQAAGEAHDWLRQARRNLAAPHDQRLWNRVSVRVARQIGGVRTWLWTLWHWQV